MTAFGGLDDGNLEKGRTCMVTDGAALETETFALSLSQQNIWNLEQAYPGTSINNISTTIRIQGRIDFNALQ